MTPINKIKKCYIMRIKMLVYVVWAFVLALGVQSCHQPDVLPEAVRYPILFGSSDSRAVATKDDLKTEGFRVHAYFKGEGAATFNQIVTYQENQKIWALSNTEYWIPGVTYWFKAFYPKELTVDITINDGASQSYSIKDYDIRTQKDIMVASPYALTVPANGVAPTSGSVVNLAFQHLLANVTIKAKSEIGNVTVSDISLEDIAQTGNYSNGKWESKQTVTVNKQYSGEALVKNAEDFVDVTGGGFLVIPEAIGGRQKMIIRTSHKNYDVVIPTITWEHGKKYTYTLTIKQENIEFNEPGVDIWDEENATGSVVIK